MLIKLARHVAGRWDALLERGAHTREQGVVCSGNTIMVASAAQVRRAVRDYFAAADRYEEALHAHQFLLADPDWHGDPAREHDVHLEPARAAAEDAATTLIAILVEGGRTPRRWTLQRWTRRVRYTRWYLREQQWHPARRCGCCRDPWAAAPLAGASTTPYPCQDEPPF